MKKYLEGRLLDLIVTIKTFINYSIFDGKTFKLNSCMLFH